MYNNIMENINSLKAIMVENTKLYEELLPLIPKEAKGKTYDELCYIANRDNTKVNPISVKLYNLRMANRNLSKVISSMEKLANSYK